MGSLFGVSLIQAKERAANSLPVAFKSCRWLLIHFNVPVVNLTPASAKFDVRVLPP
jgi:hypothetical protein